MSESAVTESEEKEPRESREGRGLFGRIALFTRQVVSELKRVVTPTREEFINYIWIVIAFVAVMMAITFVLDFGFHSLTDWVFGN